jgi:carboxyl-terminal processing protease
MALPEAVKLMRGKPKTPIVLTVVRKGESQPLEVRLVRDVIKVQSVRARVIEPGYGFIRISQFQERTVEDLVKAINDLQRQGATQGLVLDLRNNPGGLLHSSVGMSAAFLQPRALVTSTDGRNEDSRRRFVAAPEDYQRGRGEDILSRLPREAKTVPMVVLVNNASASASEIVAGALQDHKRAVVMGTQTFGKGSVQTIIPIRAEGNTPAAIKLTTARYYTPSGRSIQAKGIVPDLLVEDTPEGNFASFAVREADLVRHLEDRNNQDAERRAGQSASPPANAPTEAPAPGANAPAASPGGSAAPAVPARRYEFGSAEDFQLRQALNHLQGKPVALAKPREAVARSEAREPAKAR